MNIEKQIKDWAKEAVKAYNDTGMSYYTQSPLTGIKEDRIDLLVLGINPGSWSVPFKEWTYRGKLRPEGLTYDDFLMGNPSYQKMRDGKERWSYWDKLYRLLEIAEMQSFVNNNDFVLTNIFFGSTKKESYSNLKIYTFQLIDILKPRCIICLGQKVMDMVLINYLKKNDKSCQIPGLPVRYSIINDMKVFGFHHPAYYYSTEEKQLVGHFLKYYKEDGINEANPLPEMLQPYAEAYINRKKYSSSKQPGGTFDYYKLINLLREYIPNIDDYKEGEKCHRIPTGKHNELKVTVTSKDDGKIAIRSATPFSKGVYVTSDMKKLLPLLKSLGWVQELEKPNIWLVRFVYKGKTEQDISNVIINTINQLKK